MHKNDFKEIVKRYTSIKKAISETCDSLGRDPASVRLIAVSKGQEAEKIRALYEMVGHVDFGESYLQEMEQKITGGLPSEISWHFLGRLQSNKLSQIVKYSKTIHALDSGKHAAIIAKLAKEQGKAPLPVFIAVNLGDESQKSGVNIAETGFFLRQLRENHAGSIDVVGLMAIPPKEFVDEDFPNPPELYIKLCTLAKSCGLLQISLGMSSDLKIAIRAGSTCVRVGTSIFGERNR